MRKSLIALLFFSLAACGPAKLKTTPIMPDISGPIRAATATITEELRNEVAARTGAVSEKLDQVSGQVGYLQTDMNVARELEEYRNRQATPLFTFAPQPVAAPKPPAGPDKILSAIVSNGQQAVTTLRQVAEVARQVQEIAAQIQELRSAQAAAAGAAPDIVSQQAPAGILGIVSLILAWIIRSRHKQGK